jgi:hypothetical protein
MCSQLKMACRQTRCSTRGVGVIVVDEVAGYVAVGTSSSHGIFACLISGLEMCEKTSEPFLFSYEIA